MSKIVNCILLLLCTNNIFLHGQENIGKGAYFSFRSVSDEKVPDSLIVKFWENNISANYGMKKIRVYPHNDILQFRLPVISEFCMFQMIFFYGKESRSSEFYYAQIDDDVQVLIKKDHESKSIPYSYRPSLIFSGKGSVKYIIRDSMDIHYNKISKSQNNKYFVEFGDVNHSLGKIESEEYCKSEKFMDYLEEMYMNVDVGFREGQLILSSFKTLVDSSLLNFYDYEFNSRSLFLHYISMLYDRAKTDISRQIISDFYSSKEHFYNHDVNDSLISLSSRYALGKASSIRRSLNFQMNNKGFPFEKQYEAIKGEKNPYLRERLLTQFFLFSNDQVYVNDFSRRDSCLYDAYSVIKSKIYKEALGQQFLFEKGSKIFPFSFPDSSGQLVEAHNLKGNVFLIDFWFEGCTGCIEFKHRFKEEIYPEFRNNPNFKVVSVNTNPDKQKWFRAMKTGKYTEKDFINLNTPLGMLDDPMLRYYKVNYAPFILLVDKRGELIAKILFQSNSSIKRMIQNALNRVESNDF